MSSTPSLLLTCLALLPFHEIEAFVIYLLVNETCSNGQARQSAASILSAASYAFPVAAMRTCILRLHHLQKLLNSDHVLESFVRYVFLEFISLMELQSWVKERPRVGVWHRECRQRSQPFTSRAMGSVNVQV